MIALSSAAPVPETPHLQAPSHHDGEGKGIAAGWALLHEAGEALAGVAQLGSEPMPLAPQEFAMRVAAAGPQRLALAERAIDDCCAALHYGITALAQSAVEGRDGTAAALTLWREFDRAREGLLALVTPLR